MRSAPPADPPVGLGTDDRIDGAVHRAPINAPGAGAYPRTRLATAARIAVAVLALGLLGASVALIVTRRPSAALRHAKPLASPTVPPMSPFAFTEEHLHPLRSARGVSAGAATSVFDSVRRSLTAFYSLSLSRPSTWDRGVPDQAWDAFAADVRGRARADASSLALGDQLSTLQSVQISSAVLDLSVLIDPSGHAQAATAVVSIRANGSLTTRRAILINIDASFVLRRLDRQWLITGWPAAHLSTEPAPPPTPAVGPSASAGATVGPSSGASS